MRYVPCVLFILCITVKIHGWAVDKYLGARHCMTNLPETKILKTTIYNHKLHKKDLNRSLEKSMCGTRDTLVDVVPSLTNIMYVPSKVMVKRCDGAANGKNTCMATNLEPKQFTVLKMDALDVKTMFAVVVEIEEHTKCKISCLTKKEDCSEKQTFMGDKCMCVCEKMEKCTAVMRWDPNECRCVCQHQDRMCSTGKTWHPVACRCESTENTLDDNSED